ncbi:helix-turn-helix domain-containing protein [Agarivorans sp. 1_MG-2023]|uniref:helix-turn-helix domain-containing protein n=1 Tax=Agarivorans sp. 1_MG-2023 TaxID=3062634 RepID=UPI0026E3D47E|nr:AraC family transcriptional regulator [Agarivorans sp. 1_MG-2023]MDO6762830.1 AraC family transcriptional regulator [Agarivorans sp. 1_MG-2023]
MPNHKTHHQLIQHSHVFERLNNARAVLHNSVNLGEQLGFARWSNCDDRTSYLKPEHHTLSVYLSGGYRTKRVFGKQQLAGGAPGKLCLMPAGHESHWQVDGELGFVHLYFSDLDLSRSVEQVWNKGASQIQLQDKTFIDDPAVNSLIQQWALNLNWQDSGDRLALDQVSQLLLGHIVKHYVDKALPSLVIKGGLAPFQLQRCKDYIEAHLAENISLNHLAQLVDLSDYHFARMFKQSSGLSPHQYLSTRRVARAKRLLLNEELSLAEIAYQVGFSSQAHFSARFKQLTGLSPKAYRLSRLGK